MTCITLYLCMMGIYDGIGITYIEINLIQKNKLIVIIMVSNVFKYIYVV